MKPCLNYADVIREYPDMSMTDVVNAINEQYDRRLVRYYGLRPANAGIMDEHPLQAFYPLIGTNTYVFLTRWSSE